MNTSIKLSSSDQCNVPANWDDDFEDTVDEKSNCADESKSNASNLINHQEHIICDDDSEDNSDEKFGYVSESKSNAQNLTNHQESIIYDDSQIFKNPSTIKLVEREKMLHWVSQLNGEQFSTILKKLTTPPSFDVKELWIKQKALRQEESETINQQMRKNKHSGQKLNKTIKKADVIRSASSAKINQKLTESDNQILLSTQLEPKVKSFKYYKSLIKRLKTPEKQFEMKVLIFKHLLETLDSSQTIDLENLVDLYFEMLAVPNPTANVIEYINECAEYLKKKKIDLVRFQLNELSNRLPPLENFSTATIKLDSWQMELLELVDQKKSAIVCAPTSAGKTIISTYAATIGRKVIFVAPSEPLAAQVGGLFREILKGNVEIITNSYHLSAHNPSVIVGTPLAIENCLIDGHFTPEYAVFDEIHELNGSEGASFERLIKMLDCPSLCLSATIKNLDQIQSWLEKLHNEKVNLIIQNRRFINLQRHIWKSDRQLHHLHPLSTLTLEDLKNPGIINNQFAFTPADCYHLWLTIEEFCSKNSNLIDEVNPNRFFKKDQRLNLYDCHLYQQALILCLHKIALIDPVLISYILNKFKLESQLNQTNIDELYELAMSLKNKKITPAILFQLNSSNCEEIYQKLILFAEQQQDKYIPYHSELLELKQKQYEAHLSQVEKFNKDTSIDEQIAKQRISELLKKNTEQAIAATQDFLVSKKSKIEKSKDYDKKTKQIILDYIEKDIQDNLLRCGLDAIDIYQPHADFCYTDEYLSDLSVAEVKWGIQKELNLRLKWDGWFLRGISRGIGLYVENLASVYQRAVQALAQQRKLAIVISDQSLAYGVNLPIRTCCLVGYNNNQYFQPLIAQQMFGRAGRRGLDIEGHIVFVNVNVEEIMKGGLSQITGNHPQTSAIATYHQISPFVNNIRMKKLLSTDLEKYINEKEFKVELQQYKHSQDFINQCQLDHDLIILFWALRNYGQSTQTFIKSFPIINKGIIDMKEKQSIKINTLFRVLVNIFGNRQMISNFDYSWEQLVNEVPNNNSTITAFIEFRIPEEYDIYKKHDLKNSIVFMGNLIKSIYNYLITSQNYLEFCTLLSLIFNRLKELIDKYTF